MKALERAVEREDVDGRFATGDERLVEGHARPAPPRFCAPRARARSIRI